jgi:glutamate synthase (NADPH/NADH) large chain
MATNGEEPTGSMGTDAPLAVLSNRPVSLFRYFKQQFAQVTNPPIDPIREKLVMTLVSCVGGEGNLLAATPRQCRLIELEQPVLTNEELAKLVAEPLADFPVAVLPALFDATAADPAASLEAALVHLCAAAERAVDDGASLLLVSDRGVDAAHAAIPSLLATSSVHHALARAGKRMRAGLIVETGEAREVADLALLIGYGAGAVNPYLAFEAIDALDMDMSREERAHHYVHALDKGLLKVMSKMGISCLSSYQGAQIFEAIGVGQDTIDRWFPGTASRVGGIGLGEIAHEALMRHAAAFDAPASELRDATADEDTLDVGGVYAWRVGGERHLWSRADTGRKVLRRVFARDKRAARLAVHAARVLGLRRPGRSRAARGGRTRREDRATVRHGRDELREHQPRSPREPRHRDEPHRRAFQHRRGRRGRGSLPAPPERRQQAERHQAGRERALRGDRALPGQRGRAPDQDRAGSEAG